MKRAMIFLMIALTGCADVRLVSYADEASRMIYADKPMTPPCREVTFQLLWRTPEQILDQCGLNTRGCTVFVGNAAYVFTAPPRTWNDERRMITLGHELMHVCLGKASGGHD